MKTSERLATAAIIGIPAIVVFAIVRNQSTIAWAWFPLVIAGAGLVLRRMAADALEKANALRRGR